MRAFLIGVALVVLILGCETPSGPGDCPNKIMLKVQIKDPPIFSWDLPCDVDGIIIYRQATSNSGLQVLVPVWDIESDKFAIASPLTYGVNPEGVKVTVEAEQLIVGDTYEVKVLRFINEMPGFDIIGETNFIYVIQ